MRLEAIMHGVNRWRLRMMHAELESLRSRRECRRLLQEQRCLSLGSSNWLTLSKQRSRLPWRAMIARNTGITIAYTGSRWVSYGMVYEGIMKNLRMSLEYLFKFVKSMFELLAITSP